MKKIVEIVKCIKNWLTQEDIKANKTNLITFSTMIFNLLWAIIKIIFGIIIIDYFWCISGIFTLDIGLSKWIYRRGRLKANYELEKEIPYYRNIGICLAIGSLMYISYMGRLLIGGIDSMKYDTIFGITIALFAFTDLGIAIRSLVVSNKKHDFLQSGLRLVGISSGITAIVLTQVALLSFEGNESIHSNLYNGISGVVGGALCLGIGIFMIFNAGFKVKKLNSKNE